MSRRYWIVLAVAMLIGTISSLVLGHHVEACLSQLGVLVCLLGAQGARRSGGGKA